MDNIQVEPAHTDRYLELLEKMLAPSAKKRGMALVACWHTHKELGEDVTVTAIWSARDHSHWNDLRKDAVLDPAWREWIEAAQPLRKGGVRRFYYPAKFSPMR